MKQVKPDRTNELVTDSSSMFRETQAALAKTFEWQKFCPYEKLLRIAAYVLWLLPKNSEHRTNTGAIMDPADPENGN